MNWFRSDVWDPSLIIGQMICIQAVFYTSEYFLLLAVGIIWADQKSLSSMFTPQVTRTAVLIQLLTSTACAVLMLKLIQRSKKCLDFACTLHFWHLIFVTIYSRAIPIKLTWWSLQLISAVLCTTVGEYVCQRFESKEILLTNNPRYEV